MFNHWLRSTDGTAADIRTVLLDYKKAFDLVDHNLLISKLYSLGVRPTVVNWIIDFLRDRSQRVKLNGSCFSSWLNVPAGVPQGTRLGPWLFLVMINDLTLQRKDLFLWKFADDCTLSEIVPNFGPSSLQDDIDSILQWTMENNFQLNPTKCKELVVSFKKTPTQYDQIGISDQPLERVSTAKVLGINISDDLKWNTHIDAITTKAAKRLYLLKQLKRANVCTGDLIRFYCSCIRSVMDYSCQVFHSSLSIYLSHDIERIQKRAMRIIFQDHIL